MFRKEIKGFIPAEWLKNRMGMKSPRYETAPDQSG